MPGSPWAGCTPPQLQQPSSESSLWVQVITVLSITSVGTVLPLVVP